ncbi:hypothetical protein [Zestomonas carbonaria]|uniref:Uncharacterized protein n=1 Tax=Zestomonas carbonaria TaxID=2762745 RepID=A0A7U7ER08_9GAMM|nr:hypothetical protein [Pseudomonas carbonaria]CAD5109574.1 hypothetical protein PSEWESI4_03880 [Pseudomonas carbonaria]
MRRQRRKLLFMAGLAVMTNMFTLLGINHGSAGAIARTIENAHNLSRDLTVSEAFKYLPGDPPKRSQPRLDVTAFICNDSICAAS